MSLASAIERVSAESSATRWTSECSWAEAVASDEDGFGTLDVEVVVVVDGVEEGGVRSGRRDRSEEMLRRRG